MKTSMMLACMCMIGCASPASSYEVYIDPTFSAYNQEIIRESLNDWTMKSNGLVTFHADVVATWGTEVPKHTIWIISSTAEAIDDLCPGSTVGHIAGCTHRNMDDMVADSSQIYLPMNDLSRFGTDMGLFPVIVRHEVGHALGLHHDTADTLMSAFTTDPDRRVTCKDVNRLDVIHGAEYSCNE